MSVPANRMGKAALLIAALVATAGRAEAQVGLTSRASRVALVVQAPAGASMQAVGAPRVLAMVGSVREATVTLRLSSTSEYRLLVHGTAQRRQASSGTIRRVWVQGLDGQFQELREGTAVTVAHPQRHAGELEREVRYRFEHSDTSPDTITLPVRYEIVVKPVI